MSEIIASPVNIVEKETRDNYGVSDAVRLIVNSFRFSQGETMLQKNLLEQIGYYTHDKLDKATILQAVEPATQAVEKIVSNRNLHARSHSVLAKDEVIE